MPSSAHVISLTRPHIHGGAAARLSAGCATCAASRGGGGGGAAPSPPARGSVPGGPSPPVGCPPARSPDNSPVDLAAAPVSLAITSVSHMPLPGHRLTPQPQ